MMNQVLEQLQGAALLWRWRVIELRAVDLTGEMEENPHFILKGPNEFFLLRVRAKITWHFDSSRAAEKECSHG
jgi:hypothetical protein